MERGQYQTMDQYGRLALSFRKSAGDNALELLRCYKSTAGRAFHRALQALEDIQKERHSNPLPPAENKLPFNPESPLRPSQKQPIRTPLSALHMKRGW
jgi:hypothetical protein